MSVKLDLEYWVYKYCDAIRDNLNTYIDAVNTEKALTDVSDLGMAAPLVLKNIPTEGFYWNMNTDSIPTEVPYVVFRWASQPEGNAGGHPSERIRIVVAIIASDELSTDSSIVTRRLMRYRKALKGVMGDYGGKSKFSLQRFELIQIPDDILARSEGLNLWAVPLIAEFSFA